MSNKKGSQSMFTQQMLAKVIEQMKNRGIGSEDQIQTFLKGLAENSTDDQPSNVKLSGEDKAYNLLQQAYESDDKKGRQLANQALKLDPNNADVYNYLADLETDPHKAIQLYRKGVKAGEQKLGKKAFEEDKGFFWGLIETRPYMRSKAGLAECLGFVGQWQKAIKLYWEMLELNPRDNQGIRYKLSSLLIRVNDFKGYEKLSELHPEESSAMWSYNKVLYYFKKEDPEMAKSQLREAVKSNKHVIDYLTGKKRLPQHPPQYISWGNTDEAIVYVMGEKDLWKETKGSLAFLKEHAKI